MQTATWLVSRQLTDAAGPWDTRLQLDDDGEYFGRVILASEGVKFISGATVYYRDTPSNRLSIMGRSRSKQESQFLSIQLQIAYLRSLEDSDRSRKASLNYLQKYMFDFHPERPDIVARMQQLASTLGGRLEYPRSSWKYMWIQRLFGWNMAKRAQIHALPLKSAIFRSWDRALFSMKERSRKPRTEWVQ